MEDNSHVTSDRREEYSSLAAKLCTLSTNSETGNNSNPSSILSPHQNKLPFKKTGTHNKNPDFV